MERRRLLLAASAASGGGGEFYCELWRYSPRDGRYVYNRTATFTIPTQMTWGDAVGLVDAEERSEIIEMTLPSGTSAPGLENIKRTDGSYTFTPEDNISILDSIEVGKTYKFLYG